MMVARRANFLRLICVLVAYVDGYKNYPNPPIIDDSIFTRRTLDRERTTIHWPSAGPVPVQKEIQLLKSGTLLRRGEWGQIQGSRELEVDLICHELGLSFDQALSIRKQLLIHKVLKNSRKLKDERTFSKIKKRFEHRQSSLQEISTEYNLPPTSIFRAILSDRVLDAHPHLTCQDRHRPAGRIVQSIISENDQENIESFLSEWELSELQTAKENDIIGYTSNCTAAEDWEQTIYNYLDEQGISYFSEESLKQQGFAAVGTPDCLLVDDFSINGRQIAWIEFKSYFASGLRENSYFTKRGLSRQVEKYEAEFGSHGAVILKNGFSERISQKYPSTLFLDGGPLYPENEYNSLFP